MKKNINTSTQKISFKHIKYSSYVIKVLMICSVILFASCDDKKEEDISAGTASIIAVSDDLDFADTEVGFSNQRAFTISNTGTQDFTVSSIDFSSSVYTADWTAGTVRAGGGVFVTVTFAPTNEQAYNGTVTINHTATSGNNTFFINGNGIDNSIIAWTQATSSASWTGRCCHTSVVFDNKIWVMGGSEGSSVLNSDLNDVWSSSDGINWTQETANAGWTGRQNPTSVVFDNKIWVMGGWDGRSFLNDVWSSSDGINWTQTTANAGWTGRYAHTSVVFDNKLWVIGGYDNDQLNDVWSSSDGINWTQETDNASWSKRIGHTSVVFDNKIWVIGGWNGRNRLNDVWSSSDGINWTQATSAGWTARRSHTSVVFDNKIWVIGGWNSLDDVWSSSDGINWTQATSSAGWTARGYHTSVVFDNKLWVIGGYDDDGRRRLNDVWYGN